MCTEPVITKPSEGSMAWARFHGPPVAAGVMIVSRTRNKVSTTKKLDSCAKWRGQIALHAILLDIIMDRAYCWYN